MGIKEWLDLIQYNIDDLYIGQIVTPYGIGTAGAMFIDDTRLEERNVLLFKVEEGYKLIAHSESILRSEVKLGTVLKDIKDVDKPGQLCIADATSVKQAYFASAMPETANVRTVRKIGRQAPVKHLR